MKVLAAAGAEVCRSIRGCAEVIEAENRIPELLKAHGREAALAVLDISVLGDEWEKILESVTDAGAAAVVLSADGSPRDENRAYELGAVDFIVMPGSMPRLLNRVKVCIKQAEELYRAEKLNSVLTERNYELEYIDALTGCENYSGFCKKAEHLLHAYPNCRYALWYSDIKNFKFVNDVFGYHAGDELLRYWCGRIWALLKENEALGRISADRIVVLVDMDGGIDDDVRSVTSDLGRYFEKENTSFNIEVCSGVYMVKPGDVGKLSIDKMLDQARIAQRSIKRKNGGGVAFFDEGEWENQWRSMMICNHFDAALRDGEIRIWLQPQYDCMSKTMIGAEVLCRWVHKELGNISPGEFIPLLESSGQVYKLDYYVWEQACALMRKWCDDADRAPVSLSVNISRADLKEPDLCSAIKGLVDKYSLPSEMLRLEITESAYMDEPDQLVSKIEKLRSMGFVVEMDDFGSGYSSLNMLKEVPVDVLKMDCRFLGGNDKESKGGIILSSILQMAHKLEMPVICEGVETIEQANFMKSLGCKLMQGYYFARPMPVDRFEDLFEGGELKEFPGCSGRSELRRLNELLEEKSISTFIFNSCIGGAAVIEYIDGECRVMQVNDMFYEISGITPEVNIFKDNLLQEICAADREGVEGSLKSAVRNGSASCEFSLIRSKKRIIAHARHVSIGGNGNVLFVTFEDMTELYEMRSEIAKLTMQLQTHMTLMPGGVFSYSAEGAQEFSYISPSMIKMLGYQSEKDFRKKFNNNFPDMVYKEDRERVLNEIDTQIKTQDSDYCEYRIEAADGSLKWVYDRGRMVRGEDGRKYFYVVLVVSEVLGEK